MPKKTRKIKLTDRKKSWNMKKMRWSPYTIEEKKKEKAFLIICEGQNTEPIYFRSFPILHIYFLQEASNIVQLNLEISLYSLFVISNLFLYVMLFLGAINS